MKTITKHFEKIKNSLYLLIALISFQSCTVDIPELDDTPPKFSFQITGDGFNHTFNQDSDFNNIQLNLRQGATYDFILTGSDAGGVKQIQWQYAYDYVEFSDPIPSPWTQTTTSPLSSVINWFGDASNPLSGNILAGKMVSEGNQVSHELFFMVKNFGGESGNSNTTYASLNVYSADHTTEIILF